MHSAIEAPRINFITTAKTTIARNTRGMVAGFQSKCPRIEGRFPKTTSCAVGYMFRAGVGGKLVVLNLGVTVGGTVGIVL